jgi:hypothetical protein
MIGVSDQKPTWKVVVITADGLKRPHTEDLTRMEAFHLVMEIIGEHQIEGLSAHRLGPNRWHLRSPGINGRFKASVQIVRANSALWLETKREEPIYLNKRR